MFDPLKINKNKQYPSFLDWFPTVVFSILLFIKQFFFNLSTKVRSFLSRTALRMFLRTKIFKRVPLLVFPSQLVSKRNLLLGLSPP